ncbi:diacylglycerol/lipid kinase family protein [Azospirillum picis]|uniref:Diacylglycerol kinase family enzyme n=1 Tax=Azospirillum picis TaxID=488438 RepID=A0ABU0MG52_9PROT|nr:diacylglycerol kinase family protein [Azospirillum picis]MBP2298539.1 diacylglycerol kinase family enzyme [Azospirillum picis]MDQ0532412.1 diacylglycerol kinase family enzyme [Azospirillum picis]
MKIGIILNRQAGSLVDRPLDDATAKIRAAFERHGAEIDLHTVDGPQCVETITRVLESDAEMVVIGGGDGTLHSAVRLALPTGKTLGVIPLGTLNLLARDLHVPLELEAAAEALAAGRVRAIDIAEVNGQPYTNSSVLGFYPTVVQERERQRKQHRLLKWPGAALAFAKTLYRLPTLDVRLDWGDGPRRMRTPMLVVSNNVYDDGFGLVLTRQALDAGKLGVYVARERNALALLRLMGRLVAGSWKQDEALDTYAVTSLTVHSRRHRLKMVNDGEIMKMEAPLHYRIRPGALKVLAPS